MPLPPYIILDTEGAGLAAVVEFNDIPFGHDRLYERSSRGVKLNAWAVKGPNALTLHLANLPPRPPPIPPTPPPHYRLRLRLALPETPEGSDRVLVDYTWDPGAQPLAGTQLVRVLSETVQVPVRGVWAWTIARPTPKPTAQDLADIGDLLGQLHGALVRRSTADVVRLQTLSLTEQATALGEDPQGMLRDYADFLRARMSAPGWTVEPFHRQRLRAVPVAAGRMLHVTDDRSAPPVLTNSEAGLFALDPYVALVEDSWQIVR